MRGCRALDPEEVQGIIKACEEIFHMPAGERNRALFSLMFATGLRIGEARSIRIGDIWQGRLAKSVHLQKKHSKTKMYGVSIPLSRNARDAMKRWFNYSGAETRPSNYWLFPPSCGGSTDEALYKWGKRVDCRAIRKALNRIKKHLGLTGRVSCHSTRKTFAKRIYEFSGNDLLACQMALRHADIQSTLCYLSVREEAVAEAIMNAF